MRSLVSCNHRQPPTVTALSLNVEKTPLDVDVDINITETRGRSRTKAKVADKGFPDASAIKSSEQYGFELEHGRHIH
eukprot:scaffold17998_cov30-Tisochrysis_lutea.AAC.8